MKAGLPRPPSQEETLPTVLLFERKKAVLLFAAIDLLLRAALWGRPEAQGQS
jgi:hypothetical protein